MWGWGRFWATALVAALGALAAPSGAIAVDPFTFGKPDFCQSEEPVRDFGMSRLPPVRELPLDEALPFGPPSVEVYDRYGAGRVVTEAGPVGYGFWPSDHEAVRLDWTVTAQLWKLDRAGETTREVDSDRFQIGVLVSEDQPAVSLFLPGQRGLYRFDARFSDRNGLVLGSFGRYIRMMRPFWRVRLGLDRRVYRPGDLVLSRPENLGTEWASFGEAFGVQSSGEGDWQPAPALTPDIWAAWAGQVGPGDAGSCSALRLPRDIEPGRYRIVKRVGRVSGPGSRFLVRSFRVLG